MGDRSVAIGMVCSASGRNDKDLAGLQLVATVRRCKRPSELDRIDPRSNSSGDRGPSVALDHGHRRCGTTCSSDRQSRSADEWRRRFGQALPIRCGRCALDATNKNDEQQRGDHGDDSEHRQRIGRRLGLRLDQTQMPRGCRPDNSIVGVSSVGVSGAGGVEQSNHDDQFPQGV